jgi:glutathione synthase/RimK-type ligase-like ATP-grasp enzyme
MYIVTPNICCESAEKIAQYCQCEFGEEIPRNKLKDFVINYGSGKNHLAFLNPLVITNKIKASLILSKFVSIPKIFLNKDEISDEDFPIIARKQNHHQGNDIIIINTRDNLDRVIADYYTKYIEIAREYRIHVFDNDASYIVVKLYEGITCNGTRWTQEIYPTKYIDTREKLQNLAIRATKALRYDFGAVDIIRDSDWNFYVLEVNSGPGIINREAEMYGEYFLEKERKMNEMSIL